MNSPSKYEGLTGASVFTGCEAVAVDTNSKKVSFRKKDGSEFEDNYDKLIIATGALAFIHPVEGTGLK